VVVLAVGCLVTIELVGWSRQGVARGVEPVPGRGRSGLRRAGCWLTASRGDPQESATENKPPMGGGLRAAVTGKGETVRQERTSVEGDPGGLVNPTRSKVKRGTAGPANVPR
jgi:hypothetical protein